MKNFYLSVISILILVLVIPSIIVLGFSTENKAEVVSKDKEIITEDKHPSEEEVIPVSVLRTSTNEIEDTTLENYVRGVLAAEMPVNFELEALKAQAVAARTFTIKTLLNPDLSKLPPGTDITDSTLHQVYKSNNDLKITWGSKYDENIKKINNAINETRGLIMTYKDQPIDASFFSTSNGYTENSEEYWSNTIPYLRSVPSPWDSNSPVYQDSKTLTVEDFQEKLGVKINSSGDLSKIVRTSSNRVSTVDINGKLFSGKEIREMLGLRSTDFTLELEGTNIIVNTKGNGHGVGMSQYGANGMAKQGRNFKEILNYYYQDIEIEDINTNQTIIEAVAKR
ncbi:stage II sporulation protein D [Robertmurraya korlensis]|uniref:stage II sporulation protein D n=1 Tax=Robertmurraya korlensis TaxID=519977 RepID=UPI00203CB462|nr:stage II sporulation protein D [Robertmurraya korlensis]MCM3603188.1 stage II sporulation protein D [Robertmurraya korlensis]